MEKILTVSIAAYNVEKYIRKALESVAIPEIIDEIEVIVIDDGGTDSTLDIAKEFENKYPDSFITVHKNNEGYGSTVNYSIDHARGKYFKILDGDDWYNREGFVKLVKYLKTSNVDVVFTNIGISFNNGAIIEYDKLNIDGRYNLSDLSGNRYFCMWNMTFKTRILRKCGIRLPTASLYTDQYLCVIPFALVKNVEIKPFPVYCYLGERDGQSNSLQSIQKHYEEAMKVNEECCLYYTKHKNYQNRSFLLMECIGYYRHVVRILLYLPTSAENLKKLREYDKRIKAISKEVYYGLNIKRYPKTGLLLLMCRMTNYYAYWIVRPIVRIFKWRTT